MLFSCCISEVFLCLASEKRKGGGEERGEKGFEMRINGFGFMCSPGT